MRVLITDGNERSALAVTRALGLENVEVVVGAETRPSLAGRSKYCSKSFVYPSPYADPLGFVTQVLESVRSYSPDAVFPISDLAMELIGRHQQDFERYTVVPIPPIAMFEQSSDKFHLMKLALQLQVPIPQTVFVVDGRVEKVLDQIKEFPVVVKPARSLVERDGIWCKTSVHMVATREELCHLYGGKEYLQQPSLIQRRVVGDGQGLFGLMNHGEPIALFAHRRLRERPPSGGVSVLRESIELPKLMTEYALRLLQQVRWHGVAMVEFKVDQASAVPMLMEVNGRFWGSLQLASDAGMNFPYLLYQMAMGRPMSIPRDHYKVGVKSRWLLGDLDHLLLRLFKPEEERRLPPGSPSKLQCLFSFCHLFERGMRYEVERFDDPGPAMFELNQYVTTILRGRV
jgi:predicted ATP-grasp superfamily ATP-dependent carboligase